MIFANDAKGNRIVAAPGQMAVCPSCNGEVVAKCGKIKVWHWAHLSADCDPWSEGMTEWHIGWQNEFPEEFNNYINFIEDEMGIPVTIASVGPNREQTIFLDSENN